MFTDRSSQYSIAAFLAVVLVVLGVAAPGFYDPTNLLDLGSSTAISAIVGIGALVVIATGNIDVSAGAVFGISGVIGAAAVASGVPAPAALLVSVLAGALLGTINAVLVTVLQLPSIIATLGTSSLFTGGLILVTNGGLWIVNLPDSFTWFGQGSLLGLKVPIVLAAVALPVAWAVLTQTPAGRRVFAVGSNLEAARLAGINAKLVEGVTFVVNGAVLGLAATLTVARQGQAQSNLGSAITMTAITIAVVGGTSVFGGTGTVLGILLAAILVESTSSALTFLHLDPLWAQTLQGVFILAAITLSVLQRRWSRVPARLPLSLTRRSSHAA
jgi:ribose/xylose/arabinose/galactoside ABC-type transport system permease subunit